MGNYCPYTNGNVVYLKCQECEDRICEKDWFFCGVAGTPLSMTKSRTQMSEYLDKMLAKREKVVIAAESGKKMTALAAMYASEREYVNMTPEGKMLLDNKELFLSKRVACSYGGFANDQLRRLQMGLLRNGNSPEWLKNKFEKRSLERVLAAQNKFDDFSLSISEDEDEDGKHPLLISGNMSNYPVTSLKSMLKGLCTTIEQYEKPQNPKALKDAVHINKHAMHIVRLYYTAFDILEQGKIITRRDKEHEELLAIRNGKYMREDGTYEPAFFDMVDSFEARFQKAVKESSLPAKPDMQKIEELLVAINKSYLSRTM